MSHGRKPRRPRWAARTDVLQAAINGAALLTPGEVAIVMTAVKPALAAIRTGHGTAGDWMNLCGALHMAQAIEAQGVVRGLREHLDTAEQVLAAIGQRAHTLTGWRAPALRFHEMESLETLVQLHEYQLGQLSGKEFAAAHRAMLSRTVAKGGHLGAQARRSLGEIDRATQGGVRP